MVIDYIRRKLQSIKILDSVPTEIFFCLKIYSTTLDNCQSTECFLIRTLTFVGFKSGTIDGISFLKFLLTRTKIENTKERRAGKFKYKNRDLKQDEKKIPESWVLSSGGVSVQSENTS